MCSEEPTSVFKGMSLNDERMKALTASLGQSFNSKIIVKNPIGERVVIPNHPYLITSFRYKLPTPTYLAGLHHLGLLSISLYGLGVRSQKAKTLNVDRPGPM